MTSPMQFSTLNNGVDMPLLGLGTYLAVPEDTSSAVSTAIDAGFRLIDTAAVYDNEREVGAGIAESGIDRRDLFVTTKLWTTDYGSDSALRAFDDSLAKLGLDYVDLYLLHWPVPSSFEATVASYQAIEKIHADGRARAIGVSNFTPEHLDDLIARTNIVPAVNQVELHPYFTQDAVREANRKHHIVTQAWSPIGGVNIRKAAEPSSARAILTHPVVLDIAVTHGKTPAQVVLRWHIENGISAIPKSVHPERIRENFDVWDFTLSADEISAIDVIDTGIRGGSDPDTFGRA
ncbi:aldo/keto reductase [Rhodococcus opacus]|uniref:aldo/keto reductase n=1 Tax=Rhodococcus opacus TaxID=37919 RepID=UPI001C448C68|nr:aldo/keto reductase [Rhodococcus opacus]MBV6756716.1 aldo/keto reductase [Rhodococcus opacus]